MYNVKGPSKILNKNTRRGVLQNIDNIRDSSKNKPLDANDNEIVNGPQLVFQTSTKRPSSMTCPRQQVTLTPEHEEIIKFIHNSWLTITSTSKEYTSKKTLHSDLYYKDEPCTQLQDFKPFDLELWWGKRLYSLITNSVNENN